MCLWASSYIFNVDNAAAVSHLCWLSAQRTTLGVRWKFIKSIFLSRNLLLVFPCWKVWTEFQMSTHKWADNLWHHSQSAIKRLYVRQLITHKEICVCVCVIMLKVQVVVDIFSTLFLPSIHPSHSWAVIFLLFQVWENDKLYDLRERLVLNYIKDLMVCIHRPNMLRHKI